MNNILCTVSGSNEVRHCEIHCSVIAAINFPDFSRSFFQQIPGRFVNVFCLKLTRSVPVNNDHPYRTVLIMIIRTELCKMIISIMTIYFIFFGLEGKNEDTQWRKQEYNVFMVNYAIQDWEEN